MKHTLLVRKSPLQSHAPMKHRRSKRARSKDFSPAVRATVMERSEGMCELCRMRPIIEIHHAIYRSAGGTGDLSNACGVCRVCHNACHSTRAMRELAVQMAKELAEEK